jgi:hypothetical protein
MSAQRVLAAAAALREFTAEQVAACCDEPPPVVLDVLAQAGRVLERVPERVPGLPGGKAAAEGVNAERRRWRVADPGELRRLIGAQSDSSGPDAPDAAAGAGPAGSAVPALRASTAARLSVAEETLFDCAAEQSADERRILLNTAMNHLRQVAANSLPHRPSWWTVELSPRRLGDELRHHPDVSTSTRLQLDVALACLTECETVGRSLPAADLMDVAVRFRGMTPMLSDPHLNALVSRFFDLVMAQLAPKHTAAGPAPGRLITAVARRRVRATVERSVEAALGALVPLLKTLGEENCCPARQGLYQVLGHLPDGRDRIVVYCDLLQILPRQLKWQAGPELLPGALVEAMAEHDTSTHLRWCATALERDLVHSPFGSDSALIGQTAHVFQELAERGADLDGSVRSRSDRTRSELLTLATTPA